MKVRIEVQPTGAYNGAPWPAVGEVIDLPDHVALGMLNTGAVSAVKAGKVETATPKTVVETATPKDRDIRRKD